MSMTMRQFEATLGLIASNAVKVAERNAINDTAFLSAKVARSTIAFNMTERNNFTRNSIRVDKAKRPGDHAVMGSIAPYMPDQEFGAVKTGGKHGKPIPTSYSAGQGRAGKRTRTVKRANMMNAIRLWRGATGAKNNRQRNRIAIEQASRNKSKFVFLNMYRRKGIFRVIGRGRDARIEMVHDLSRKSIRIKANPVIRPSALEAGLQMGRLYESALKFQLQKLGYL